ncbi:MAG: serpin family protein [Verrucomicrobiota bacterium]
MKKLLSFIFVASCVFRGYSEPLPADHILAFVRTKLPDAPLKLTGTLKVRTKNGFTKANLPVEMNLEWGAETPVAEYRIDKELMAITWKNDVPEYSFSNKKNKPTDDILDTGITWADLSFSVLWWPGSKLIDESSKINRECYVVDVPVPDSENTMRLWIEKKMGMLLEAQTLNAKGKQISRMKIKSIKKMNGMWVAKDLEIKDQKTGSKTTLQITDLEWKNPVQKLRTVEQGTPNYEGSNTDQTRTAAKAFDPAESVNQFTFDLYKKLAAEKDGNLFLSPYSISSALAMVYGGARGETAEQINRTFRFGGQGATHPAFSFLRKKLNGIQGKGHVQLSVANSLWPQKEYTFLPDYLSLTKEFYGSEIVPVDYKADTEGTRLKINGWVEEKTNDRIKDLIPQGMLDPITRLVLANAIYFKGDWTRQFRPEATRPAPFKLADGSRVGVPMMSQTDDFKLARGKDFQALELPYEGGDLSMVVLLSNKPGDFPSLDSETLSNLQFNEMEVLVQLPKFKLESEFRLGDMLAAMGMPLAFSDKADFSGMDGSRELYIGAVVHKAFVEVNEEGTEAAAATAVVMKTTSICMPPQFIANRPFLFLIRENSTGAILFIGRVANPAE